jgi:hypothetical protein
MVSPSAVERTALRRSIGLLSGGERNWFAEPLLRWVGGLLPRPRRRACGDGLEKGGTVLEDRGEIAGRKVAPGS